MIITFIIGVIVGVGAVIALGYLAWKYGTQG